MWGESSPSELCELTPVPRGSVAMLSLDPIDMKQNEPVTVLGAQFAGLAIIACLFKHTHILPLFLHVQATQIPWLLVRCFPRTAEDWATTKANITWQQPLLLPLSACVTSTLPYILLHITYCGACCSLCLPPCCPLVRPQPLTLCFCLSLSTSYVAWYFSIIYLSPLLTRSLSLSPSLPVSSTISF